MLGRGILLICVCGFSALSFSKNDERRHLPQAYDSIFPQTEYTGSIVGLPYKNNNSRLNQQVWSAFPSLEHQDIYVYGWLSPSYNISSNSLTNVPTGFPFIPNDLEMDQGVLVVEKKVNTVQTQSMDVGFKLTNLYGLDYEFTAMKGVFSNQINQNLQNGYDPVEAYTQIYFPFIAQGSVLTVGRYLAPADIEDPYTKDTTLVSHSMGFIWGAYTNAGFNFDTKIDDHWAVLLGMHYGSDMAPWSISSQPTFQAFVQWISNDNNDSVWAGIDALNNGEFKNYHDNLQQLTMVWNHRFTPETYLATEIYYEYQYNARLGGSCIKLNFAGTEFRCGPIIPGLSSSFSAMGQLQHKWTEKDFTSVRMDYFNDFQGQRTGYVTGYLTWSLGLTHMLLDTLKIRPEVRVGTSTNEKPYNNGEDKNFVFGLLDIVALL